MNILSHQGKIGPRGLVGFTGVKGPPVSKTSFKAGDVDMEIKTVVKRTVYAFRVIKDKWAPGEQLDHRWRDINMHALQANV